jgi:hypothetical protein
VNVARAPKQPEHDTVDIFIETGDKKYLPAWENEEAVIELFRDEEMREWISSEWPWLEDVPPPRTGKKGRPKMSQAEKERSHPTHRAASMVALAKFILSYLYPEQRRKKQMVERACKVVESMTGVPARTLQNYVKRTRGNRRRLV